MDKIIILLLGVDLDVNLDDVSNITNPMDKVVAGLQSNGDVKIPLKSVHVRAKLQDLTSEVIPQLDIINTY